LSSARAKQPGQDLRSLYDRLTVSLAAIDGATTIVLVCRAPRRR
jgi:hypothetical protein